MSLRVITNDLDPFKTREFQWRRNFNWIILGLLYALFYMSRYNFAATMGPLSQMFGWTNTDLGRFEFVMPLVYGLSVVFNGPLTDRIGGKKAFLIGAVGAAVANMLFGICLTLVQTAAVVHGAGHNLEVVTPVALLGGVNPKTLYWMMISIWGINGYFQSFGALAIIKVNVAWFSVGARGTFSGFFGVLIRLGLWLAFSLVPIIGANLGLQWAYFIPGIAVAVFFFINLIWLKNSPADAGFGVMDTCDGSGDDEKPASLIFVLRRIFATRVTWTLALASMMLGMVRRSTVDSWNPKYFASLVVGGDISAFAPYQTSVLLIVIFGIIGGFAFGIFSDKRLGGRRAPVIGVGFGGMAVMLALFGLSMIADIGPWAATISLGLLSFFVNGSHGMIGGAASMDFGGKKAAATAAGMFDGMQYLASAFVGPGMGWILDNWGWNAWPWCPIPFAAIGFGLMLTIWNVLPKKKGSGH